MTASSAERKLCWRSAASGFAPKRPSAISAGRPQATGLTPATKCILDPAINKEGPGRDEAPRFHRYNGRRLVARRSRAAEGDAGDWLPQRDVPRPTFTACCRVPPGTQRNRRTAAFQATEIYRLTHSSRRRSVSSLRMIPPRQPKAALEQVLQVSWRSSAVAVFKRRTPWSVFSVRLRSAASHSRGGHS